MGYIPFFPLVPGSTLKAWEGNLFQKCLFVEMPLHPNSNEYIKSQCSDSKIKVQFLWLYC